MSDVDAVRWMASEHDLEFVDLDTYGVDPAAGEILPVSLSRRHHVVAIKRKFGHPVVATADPDDVAAQETVRDSIGRDFISVVASRDQIGDYLDQLFGPVGEDGLSEGSEVGEFDTSHSSEFQVNSSLLAVDEVGRDDRDPDGEVGPWSGFVNDSLPEHDEDHTPHAGTAESSDEQLSTGKHRRKRVESKQKASKAKPAGDSDVSNVPEGERGTTEPGDLLETVVSEHEEDQLTTVLVEPIDATDKKVELTMHPTGDGGAGRLDLEPATSLLPEFGSASDETDWSLDAGSGALDPDPLAALARSVEDGEQNQPSTDSAALAADLVAEAVATYEVKHGEEQRYDAAILDAPTSTSLFPPLAKALVDGERVSFEDMEGVLEEHSRTGQTIARILTAKDLVTEADLMWGMAEEMGLDFVDLDTVGVDFTEAGTIPEATDAASQRDRDRQ